MPEPVINLRSVLEITNHAHSIQLPAEILSAFINQDIIPRACLN